MAYDNSKDIAAIWLGQGNGKPIAKIKVNAANLAKALRDGAELDLVVWGKKADASDRAPDYKIQIDTPRDAPRPVDYDKARAATPPKGNDFTDDIPFD